MTKHKILHVKALELDATIEKYENEGWSVCANTWVSCNLEYVLILRRNEKNRKNKKIDTKKLEEDLKKALKEISKNPTPPYSPNVPWPNTPYPYIDPYPDWQPLKAPHKEPYKMPDIVWCGDNLSAPKYTTTCDYKSFDTTTDQVFFNN